MLIVREDDGGSIADQLERAGVIDSAMWFNILTLLDGNRGALKRGEYEFKAGISMTEIENELLSRQSGAIPDHDPRGTDERPVRSAPARRMTFSSANQRIAARGLAAAGDL